MYLTDINNQFPFSLVWIIGGCRWSYNLINVVNSKIYIGIEELPLFTKCSIRKLFRTKNVSAKCEIYDSTQNIWSRLWNERVILYFHCINTYLIRLDFFFWGNVENCVYMGPGLFHSMNKRSHWVGNKRYASTCMARSGILVGHVQGHEWHKCGHLLMMFETIWVTL
jgi:hypothetical protein